MTLTIERRWKKQGYTIGILYVNGNRFCETLEDTVRVGEKIPGATAIPAGRYQIDMNTVSPKFRERVWARVYDGVVPRLQAVPGFEGILIHPGNTPADTSGCILVGDNTEVGHVWNSQARYYQLMDNHLIPARDRGERIVIHIID